MDDAFPHQSNEPITNLTEQANSLSFIDLRVGLHVLLQIAVADLLDDVIVVTALHDIQHTDYVLGLEQLKNLNFREEGGLEVVVMVN